ncbi:hypothetical protein GGX14DRAFT_653762 [Mycena pura]|uniref:Uncharacterized protein n=1 Tax=Mycena pura TaxID=153505 RepID=A0AAD6VBQ7_9AGAR|nr:hypothetical protein GGX14DRAFT_653762 [Mycena pura]
MKQNMPMGHVNMMADTVIVNASTEDLRAILRNMLASKTPGLVAAFISSTQARLNQHQYQRPLAVFTEPDSDSDSDSDEPGPAPQLLAALRRARLLFGSGLGFASLAPLTSVVRATIGRRWDADGAVAEALVMADADIAQALQSCRDEVQGSETETETLAGQAALDDLALALEASRVDVNKWCGEFPFERALYSVRDFKL